MINNQIEDIAKSVLQDYAVVRHYGSLLFLKAQANVVKYIFLPIDKRGELFIATPYACVTCNPIEIVADVFNKNIKPRCEFTLQVNFGHISASHDHCTRKFKMWNIAHTSELNSFRAEFTELYSHSVISLFDKASFLENMPELIDIYTPIKLHKLFRLPLAYLLTNRYDQSIAAINELSQDPSVKLNVPHEIINSFREYILKEMSISR